MREQGASPEGGGGENQVNELAPEGACSDGGKCANITPGKAQAGGTGFKKT